MKNTTTPSCNDVVTLKITPKDKRRNSVCYDLNTPILLGRFLQDNQHNTGKIEFVRGTELEWVQRVLVQIKRGHDFWERV